MDSYDFYKMFDARPDAATQAATLSEFAAITGNKRAEYYAGGWSEKCLQSWKHGKPTYTPLEFPEAEKFSDLFAAVSFRSTKAQRGPGQFFLSDNGSYCAYIGGRRGWSERTPGTRSHYGAEFYGTYVTPHSEVLKAMAERYGRGYTISFEAIRRTDGILITCHPSEIISSYWLALLPLSEDICTYYTAAEQKLIADNKADALSVWGEPC